MEAFTLTLVVLVSIIVHIIPVDSDLSRLFLLGGCKFLPRLKSWVSFAYSS